VTRFLRGLYLATSQRLSFEDPLVAHRRFLVRLALLLQPLGLPVDVLRLPGSLSDGLGRADTAVREWVGLVVYRLAGKTEKLFPTP